VITADHSRYHTPSIAPSVIVTTLSAPTMKTEWEAWEEIRVARTESKGEKHWEITYRHRRQNSCGRRCWDDARRTGKNKGNGNKGITSLFHSCRASTARWSASPFGNSALNITSEFFSEISSPLSDKIPRRSLRVRLQAALYYRLQNTEHM
jgi:hypothetical protein